MIERNPIEELEEWLASSKKHSCEISHDDGYGASGWEVQLHKREPRHYTSTAIVVVVEDITDKGLGATILVALDKARSL